ncbi:MAG: polysaccharide biosynthesis tyrosine autokinase [Alphaproteobacteria bacterium]|nr:polysaccharide biosynthesis tyrosine autokinase [Alphaproteobacteria bacterium]
MNQEQLMMMTDVREIWLFVRRNAKLILLIAVSASILAFISTFIIPPRYTGEAVIMLDPRKTNLTNVQSVLSNLPAENAAVRSEIDIIESRAVINRVIEELDLLNNADFNPSLSGTRWFLRLFASRKPESKQQQISEDRSAIANKLTKRLTVENDGRSYSIVLKYRDRDPAQAAKIANSFADQYLVDQLEVKYDITQRANAWLSKRLSDLRDKVGVAERAIEDYKTSNNLVDVGDETITQQQLSAIDEHLLEARAERSQAEARYTSVKNMGEHALETSSVIIASPLIQQLKQQEAEVRRKEADLATRYGDRHPMIIDTRNELRSIRDKIAEEIKKIVAGLKNDYDIASSKTDSLERELTRLKAETGEGNKAMVVLRQMQREASSNRSLYEGFLNRFKQIAEQQDLQIADSRIIARAEPPIKPHFPKKWIFTGVGAAAGLVLGFLLTLLLEYLDRGMRSLTAAEKLYGISGLGIVPLAETSEGQLPTDYLLEKPLSIYAESIRSIRAAIHFSNVDRPPKTVVVTSSFPNEGKTVFSSSLARLLAKSGQKTILIDADMRRPRIHSILGLDKNKPDLASVLAGKATLAQALQKDASGADVIIARARTMNPQDLLNSHQMEKLLNTLRENYDMVIIDTPPVMAVADAALIGQKADTTVYVARWSATPKEVIGEGLKQLAKFNIRLAGMVLTQVDLQDKKQYGYDDYSYYYGQYKSYYTN